MAVEPSKPLSNDSTTITISEPDPTLNWEVVLAEVSKQLSKESDPAVIEVLAWVIAVQLAELLIILRQIQIPKWLLRK